MDAMKSQFSLGKNKTDTSKRLKMVNIRNEMGVGIDNNPKSGSGSSYAGQRDNDFDTDSNYITVVVRNRRRKLLRGESAGMYACMCMQCMYVLYV